jgi:hypothetical protein
MALNHKVNVADLEEFVMLLADYRSKKKKLISQKDKQVKAWPYMGMPVQGGLIAAIKPPQEHFTHCKGDLLPSSE